MNRSIFPLVILAVGSATSAVLVGEVLNHVRPLNPPAHVKQLTRAELDTLLEGASCLPSAATETRRQ